MPSPEGSHETLYPIFGAFGPNPRRLTNEEAESAPFESRLESIWPYLMGRVIGFSATLSPRERANSSPEDQISEIVIRLKEKDEKWEPARGCYLSFASRIVDNELSSIRNEARVVHSPRNSTCRIKRYERDSLLGEISDRKSKTYDAIKATVHESQSFDEWSHVNLGDLRREIESKLIDKDQRRVAREAIIEGLKTLMPFEAAVIGKTYGLWGTRTLTISETAKSLGTSVNAVKHAKERAINKIRSRLVSMGHPASRSD